MFIVCHRSFASGILCNVNSLKQINCYRLSVDLEPSQIGLKGFMISSISNADAKIATDIKSTTENRIATRVISVTCPHLTRILSEHLEPGTVVFHCHSAQKL